MKAFQWLLDQLFPNKCAGCGKVEQSGICESCYSKLPFVGRNACPRCGREKKWCWCGRKPVGAERPIPMPGYQQLTAPFYYEGLSRDAIGHLKFRHQRYHARWLGAEMVAKIREQMDISMIDAVVPVPLSAGRMRERGFNQAALLAKEISDSLGIACREELLQKVKENKIQHTLTRAQRMQNAEGAYFADKAAAGLRILLIDDISTTGATLESCAKTLTLAGAEAVVCCTAAVTKWENEEVKIESKQ